MNKFIVMCGIAGSGKSTLAKELSKTYNAKIFSSDDLREELLGDINSQEQNSRIFEELRERAKKTLENGENIIIDSTNIKMKHRRNLLEFVDPNHTSERICCIVAPTVEYLYKNNAGRSRRVPEFVIEKQLEGFHIPFYEEGFDSIGVNSYKEKCDINLDDIYSEMENFDQKTKWHKYPLKTHCLLCCSEIVKEISSPTSLISASIIHDYGKLFTQTFDEEGQAHYYGHANIGAYRILSHFNALVRNSDISGKLLLEILFYINYHMFPFTWEAETTHKKYQRIFGEEKYNNIILLNKCDKIASGRTE